MSEINSFLESVDYENLTTTQKRQISEIYGLAADTLTEVYEYDTQVGSEVNNTIINPDNGGFGDYVGEREGLNSSVDEYNHAEYQTVDSKHDHDKILPISLEDPSTEEVMSEIKRQFPGLQSESDTQEDTDNDTQEDTTQEVQTTQDSSVQVIDAETLQDEVKQFGDVSENSLEDLHEQIGDFKVTSDTFKTSIVDEYDSLESFMKDPDTDSNDISEEEIEALANKQQEEQDEDPTVDELFDSQKELALSDRSESEFERENIDKLPLA